MRFKCSIWITVAAFLAITTVPNGLSAQDLQAQNQIDTYRVVNLGTLGGTSSAGNTINNLGWVMGVANLNGDTTAHAILWAYGLKLDLGTLGGSNSAIEWPVKNNFGVIAGIAETSAVDPLGEKWSCSYFFPTLTYHVCRGFVWQWGKMTALPTLGGVNGYASGVNNVGQIVGWAETTFHDPTCTIPQVLQFRAVLYGQHGEIQELPPYRDDPDSAATAINDKGQVVGISGICEDAIGELSAEHAVLWQNGEVIDLGSFGGAGWNTPTSINSRGDVVGFSDLPGDLVGNVLTANYQAFLWTNEGGMTKLGVLPGDSYSAALGINDQGEIVGQSIDAKGNSRAFLWKNGLMIDLNSVVPSGSPLYLVYANDTNNSGAISGGASDQTTGETPAFVATPPFSGFDAVSSTTQDGRDQAPKAILPAKLRQQILEQRGLGIPRTVLATIR